MVAVAQPNRGSSHLLLLLHLLPWRGTLLFLHLLHCGVGHQRRNPAPTVVLEADASSAEAPAATSNPDVSFIGLFW
jgi:hypothetical protein